MIFTKAPVLLLPFSLSCGSSWASKWSSVWLLRSIPCLCLKTGMVWLCGPSGHCCGVGTAWRPLVQAAEITQSAAQNTAGTAGLSRKVEAKVITHLALLGETDISKQSEVLCFWYIWFTIAEVFFTINKSVPLICAVCEVVSTCILHGVVKVRQ